MYMFRVSVPIWNKMWEMHYWQNCRHTLYRKSHVKKLSFNSNIRYFKAICTAQIHSPDLKCCTCTCKLYPCNVLTTKLIYHVCWSVKGFIVVQQDWYQYIKMLYSTCNSYLVVRKIKLRHCSLWSDLMSMGLYNNNTLATAMLFRQIKLRCCVMWLTDSAINMVLLWNVCSIACKVNKETNQSFNWLYAL